MKKRDERFLPVREIGPGEIRNPIGKRKKKIPALLGRKERRKRKTIPHPFRGRKLWTTGREAERNVWERGQLRLKVNPKAQADGGRKPKKESREWITAYLGRENRQVTGRDDLRMRRDGVDSKSSLRAEKAGGRGYTIRKDLSQHVGGGC